MPTQAERSAAAVKALLAAARALFGARGYAAVSIDEIAAEAGYAKGAFYHHFGSKKDVFERVLDAVQAELAAALAQRMSRSRALPSPRSIADHVLFYLNGANQPEVRQILLIDGPAVLGWQRWREIDDAHFAGVVRGSVTFLMGKGTREPLLEAATQLVLGAILEAALSSGAADDPARAAREHCAVLEKLLTGLQAR